MTTETGSQSPMTVPVPVRPPSPPSPLGPLGPDRGLHIRGRTISPRWLLSLVWLFFLNSTFAAAFALESPVRRVFSLVLLVAFCFLYGYAFSIARFSRWSGGEVGRLRFTLVVGLAVGLTLAACLLIGETGLALIVYDAVMAVMLMATGPGFAVVAVLVAVAEVSSRTIDGWTQQDSLAFSIPLAAVAVWGITQMASRNLDRKSVV